MILVQGIALGLTVVTGIDGDGRRLDLEKFEGISPMTASWLDSSRLRAPRSLKTLVARGLGQCRLESTGTAKWPTAALWTPRAASSLAQGVQPAPNGKHKTWIDQVVEVNRVAMVDDGLAVMRMTHGSHNSLVPHNFGETRLLQGGQGFDGSMCQVPRLDHFLIYHGSLVKLTKWLVDCSLEYYLLNLWLPIYVVIFRIRLRGCLDGTKTF
uniref:Uncharacterized protein n=1 Tax=Oryza rufipogon TaxID=4529 RepID=A0A0E0NX34_ORYRU